MNLIKEIKDAIEILKLNKPVMAAVAARPSALKWGLFILIVPPVVNLVLSSMMFPSGFRSIYKSFTFWPMFLPAISLCGAVFIMSYIAAKFFKSAHNHLAFYKVLSYASIFLWLTVAPFLLGMIGILYPEDLNKLLIKTGAGLVFFIAYRMFLDFGKLSKQISAMLVLIGVILFFLLQNYLGRILVGEFYRSFY